ncbi:MAG: zinc-binding dehydrogenase [bacterium]
MDHRRNAGHRRRPSLEEVAKLVDSEKLRPVLETVLPLSDARRAHEISQTGHRRGKIVLRVV